MRSFKIADKTVGEGAPTYFIADISANHDGSLDRALELVRLCAEAGANAAKFQNFRAEQIVSEFGFATMGAQQSHQSKWKKSVTQVYREASIPWEWTGRLKAACDAVGIHYFSTPYDFGAVDMLSPYVPAFKIGSGDITWQEMLKKVANENKPVLLATGASDMGEVQRAVATVEAIHPEIGLMQCNTNYTGSLENFKHIHLNVLKSFRAMFPEAVLGLSDHTPGHATVLGAVALGARIIEKHFTDDNTREGPDHPFSMTPATWREMVDRTRELEYALGSANKVVCENERATVVVQRRCLRTAHRIESGSVLTRDMIDVLRPAPEDCIKPFDIDKVIGMRTRFELKAGEGLKWSMLEEA